MGTDLFVTRKGADIEGLSPSLAWFRVETFVRAEPRPAPDRVGKGLRLSFVVHDKAIN